MTEFGHCFRYLAEAAHPLERCSAGVGRWISGLQGDGGQLAQEALGLGKVGMPFLAFNSLRTKTEQDEQVGLMNLMVGMLGAFRNTTGHAPKVSWPVGEQDALDLLTLASFLHRRLDGAVRTPLQ
jgi:uncharacterized protein (TIGR02391 family)